MVMIEMMMMVMMVLMVMKEMMVIVMMVMMVMMVLMVMIWWWYGDDMVMIWWWYGDDMVMIWWWWWLWWWWWCCSGGLKGEPRVSGTQSFGVSWSDATIPEANYWPTLLGVWSHLWEFFQIKHSKTCLYVRTVDTVGRAKNEYLNMFILFLTSSVQGLL